MNDAVCQNCSAYEAYKNGIHAKCPKTGYFDSCEIAEKEDQDAWDYSEETNNKTSNNKVIINTEGLDVELRCTLCQNPMKSDRGCDGACQYNVNLYKSIMDALEERMSPLKTSEKESLTDKEQRIFLAAMAREENICKEVDRDSIREPYEDSLMQICKEIKRKVKKVLRSN